VGCARAKPGSARRRLSAIQLPAQGFGLHEVGEGLLAVDLHDRDQLSVASLELGVGGDVDLLQLEAELVAEGGDRVPRPLAEVASLGAVENDAGYG
jgi:hypothetical protein